MATYESASECPKTLNPLRLPVDHEQHLVALAHAAYVDRPRASARDAVAREAAFADEQPRHLRRQHRKQRRLRGLLYLLRAYPAHVERQERRIGLGRGNHGYFGKGHCVAWRPGRRSGRARCRNGSRHEGDYWCHMRLLRSFCGDRRKTSPRFRPQKYSKIPNLHRTARITVPHSVILVSTSRQCHTVFRKTQEKHKSRHYKYRSILTCHNRIKTVTLHTATTTIPKYG